VGLNVSAPPTSAAVRTPFLIKSAAMPIAAVLDEQAVVTVVDKPLILK
jgi:hypothetical protein